MIDAPLAQNSLVNRASAAFSRFREGDRSAFDELVEMATPLMWHTVRGAGCDKVSAEDVLQTVWLNLLHHVESVREPQTIVKWLLTTSRREAWRTTQKERNIAAHTAYSSTGTDDEMTDVPGPPDAMPDAVVLRERGQQQLWDHILNLPPKCRLLLRVIAFADRPDYAVIAKSLGMPVGSIGPTRGRCLAKLRDQLARDPEWEQS